MLPVLRNALLVLRCTLLVLLAVGLMTMGVLHFVAVDAFVAVMPPYLPWHRELVLISGVCEFALGAAALVPRLRPWAGLGIVALLVAVFPANVHMAIAGVGLPGQPPPPIWALWARLPLQAVLIALALWTTRARDAWRVLRGDRSAASLRKHSPEAPLQKHRSESEKPRPT